MARYRIVWEDPDEIDAPVKVTVPSDNWLGKWTSQGFTEERATEFCCMHTLPSRCFGGNRQHFAIVPIEAIPTDRSNRNAWRLGDFV